jgi:prepilin-type N-terminal cleavage/methylation domain-containing protein
MPKKGFTLIELLVVIAIIGILASIVLVSLSGARNKAKDARIQGDLNQARSLAEMIMDDTTTGYTELCDSTTPILCSTPANCANNKYTSEIGTIKTDIAAQGGGPTACFSSASAFCASAALNAGGFYCTDSTGKAVKTSAACTTTVCP